MSLGSSVAVVLVAEAFSFLVVAVVLRGASFVGLSSMGFECGVVGCFVVAGGCYKFLGLVFLAVGFLSSWGLWVLNRIGMN